MKPTAYKWNLAALQAITPDQEKTKGPYACFDQINGNHPFRYAVPNGYIEYQCRILKKSKVVYFNFQLAKDMGLIEKNHPNKLNPELEKKLIDTFALRIINEYDQLSGTEFPNKEIKNNRYMATRYLQLQHSSKKGHTSGDGRSIWNGHFTADSGIDWDISSCGTGVTRLSPGSVVEGKPVKTGDKKVSYGSGLADIDEGLTAAILSESFHHREILTERTLLVIEGPESRGINIRAAKNLLRPSHLFLHLKQGNQLMLKSALDFYLTKQIFNRDLSAATKEQSKYDVFLKRIAEQYAEFCARLEDEYVFCWLDWDGDNMLMDGGIIDYGSIRQFGLCHHHYRYDDVDRYSTNLKEQKLKAKYLVQTFVQLVSFVETGTKKELGHFSASPYLAQFEKTFREKRTDLLLKRVGLKQEQRKRLIKYRPDLVTEFERLYRYFERKESARGIKATADGVNNPAIFNARALLRELPKKLLIDERELSGAEFLEMIRTPFLSKKEAKNLEKAKIIQKFQKVYLKLLTFAYKNQPLRKAVVETMMRSSQLNRSNFVTGDGIILVVDHLLKKRKTISRAEFQKVVDGFTQFQKGEPQTVKLKPESRKILHALIEIVGKNSHSL